jgi:hypothetical protein
MKRKQTIAYYAPWIAITILVFFNIFLGISLLSLRSQLFTIRGQVTTALGGISAVIDNLQASTFEYTFHIDEELPINTEIPVEFIAQVPINTTIPVNTTVKMPVEIPLVGTTYLSIPIIADIPVDLVVDLPVQQTLPIDISVPVQLDVPIRIRVTDTPLAQSLTDLQAFFNKLTVELGGVDRAPAATP